MAHYLWHHLCTQRGSLDLATFGVASCGINVREARSGPAQSGLVALKEYGVGDDTLALARSHVARQLTAEEARDTVEDDLYVCMTKALTLSLSPCSLIPARMP